MKDAFDKYYENLKVESQKMFSTNPTAPYLVESDRRLYISEPDSDEYAEWKPVAQEHSIDWKSIEEKLKVTINDELKEYYSTYLFLECEGTVNQIRVSFEPLINEDEIPELIYHQFNDAQHIFENSQLFLLGIATYKEYDGYHLFYDNETKKLFCYDIEMDKKINIDMSLFELISKLKY